MLSIRDPFEIKRYTQTESKRMENIYFMKMEIKQNS